MSEGRAHEVSEVGEFLASIATSLPERTRDELVRLLGHSVALPSQAEIREARLGLLVELVTEGEIPKVTSYIDERTRRQASGEAWPSHTDLCTHFGSWTGAARAALDLYFDNPRWKVKSSNRRVWKSVPYSRREIEEAVRRSSGTVGRAITQWEYVELRRLERRVAATCGLPDPRLPSLTVIRRAFGSWERAALLAGD